ncbi:CLEC3A [Mytilus edulis]|uniref:CLEC3A n=1 Tax=Mytilus edulis TaxID=6550 RepID=A0A8S3UJX7_MYTED|nr:CLEC3A [Mytilus edulis]
MTIRCFLLSATVYVITVCLLYAVNINAKDVESFQTEGSTRAIRSLSTSDFHCKSLLICAQTCLSNRQCCVASFSKGTSTCRLDISEKCCIDTETKDGWRTIRRKNYLPINCTGCITFCNSVYSIIPDYKEWENAKENCICLGGKLLELETSEENEFIKDTVRTLNTGVMGYWIEAIILHNDGDLEWLSKPNQAMPFSDWKYPQPHGTADEACMGIWRGFDFRWGDYCCTTPLSYICEFEHQ